MRYNPHRRFARREDLGLTPGEFAVLRRLATPQKIQCFLNAICINHEIEGETILSVREVLAQRRAHCIEAAFVGACAFWVHGEPPLVMHLDCVPTDYPHVIALFRRRGAWGADLEEQWQHASLPRSDLSHSSRARHVLLPRVFRPPRAQDPAQLFRTFRPAHIASELWVTSKRACRETNDRLAGARHYPLVTVRQERLLARRDRFERDAAKTVEYPRRGDRR
jgi:hypothetical protein